MKVDKFKSKDNGRVVLAGALEGPPDPPALTETGARAGVGDFQVSELDVRRWGYRSKAGFEREFVPVVVPVVVPKVPPKK